MNSNVMPSVIKIDRENLEKLVTEVKETIATGVTNQHKATAQKKTFGLVDMWNCQRNMKTAVSMRRY